MIEKVKIEADESLPFGYFVTKLEDGRWSGVAYKLGPKHDVTDQIERILAIYGNRPTPPSQCP